MFHSLSPGSGDDNPSMVWGERGFRDHPVPPLSMRNSSLEWGQRRWMMSHISPVLWMWHCLTGHSSWNFFFTLQGKCLKNFPAVIGELLTWISLGIVSLKFIHSIPFLCGCSCPVPSVLGQRDTRHKITEFTEIRVKLRKLGNPMGMSAWELQNLQLRCHNSQFSSSFSLKLHFTTG